MTDHATRNQQQLALLLGSGDRPTAWCTNPSCHEPIDPQAIDCPHCKAPQTPLLMTPVQVSPVTLAYLAREGAGMICIRRSGVMVERRIFEVEPDWLPDALNGRR